MRKNLLFTSFLVLTSFCATAQLTVDNTSFTPTQLVQNVLVGTGVTVSNVMWNGSLANALVVQPQSGTFSGTSTAGIPYGVILGSGDVTEAIGPNVGGGTTLGGSGMSGTDPDLQSIASSGIKDEAVLEFDFIPEGDSIKFQYAFASEEYPEYVCSTFNDVFGFFITGPNPFGPAYSATNIALIPGSGGLPVTINSVNPGTPGSSSGGGTCTSLAYSMYYINNLGGLTLEYDGLTTVLTAQAAVECGQTYHIKLAISDVGDFAFDSGVFLQAGSFSSNAVDVTITTPTSTGFVDGSIYENCILGTDATFYLVRPNSSTADTIPFSFTGSATLGSDYTSSTPDTFVIFTAGQDSASFGLSIINDGITEGVDSLVVTVYNINPCGDTILSTGTLYIHDPLIIVPVAPDDTIPCAGQPVTLIGSATGSPLDMHYQWTGPGLSDTSTTTTYNPPGEVMVTLTATDECGFTGTDTLQIHIVPVPVVAAAGPDQSVSCAGASISLSGTGSSGTGTYTYDWSGPGLSSSSATVPSYAVTTSGPLIFTVTDACGQTDSDTMQANIVSIPVIASAGPDQTVPCSGISISLSGTGSSGTGTYTYDWSGPGLSSSSATVPSYSVTTSGPLIFTVTDACGQTDSDTVEVTIVPVPVTASAGADQNVTCPGNSINLNGSTSGGTGTINYQWTYAGGPISSSSTTTFTPMTTELIFLTVVDGCGQTDTDTLQVTVPVIAPYNLTYTPTANVTCPGDPANLSVTVNSGGVGSPYLYLWDNSATTSSTTYNVTTSPTVVHVIITDNCGLDTSIAYTLTISVFNPLTVSSIDGTICNGLDNMIVLPVSISGGAGNNVVTWSGPSGTTTVHDYTINAGIVSAPVTGNYIVQVTDQCGNFDVDTSDVTVIPCQITIPNIVTPNGDGANDVIVIDNLEYHPHTSFVLYNRWGQVKYENSDYLNDYSPTDLTDGVYFYIIKLTDGTTPAEMTGTIQVAGNK